MHRDATMLPARIEGRGGLLLRRWVADDAEDLTQAIADSLGHLRPWMAWIAYEPIPVERRRARIEEWEREWAQGGDAVLGVFLAERIVGGCGLHRRLGPNGLELGYWIHPGFLRRGLATTVASVLTDAALSLPDISHVEIHHDKANLASAGVPRKLGFQLLGEWPDDPDAPADLGIECRWRIDKQAWKQRPRGSPRPSPDRRS